jgi:hypothetical protein
VVVEIHLRILCTGHDIWNEEDNVSGCYLTRVTIEWVWSWDGLENCEQVREGLSIGPFGPRGVHSLLYFAYTCVRDLFIGGGEVIYLAKKIIRWWYFTCKKHENIICDGILHVNMFHYFKIPYFTCTFLQDLPTMNILDPIFNRTLFHDFRQWIPRALALYIILWRAKRLLKEAFL